MPANYNLGTAHGTIVLNAASLGRATAALDAVANRMLLLGGLAVAGLGLAVKAAADFENELSRFSAISDATEAGMEKIRKKALQLGQDSAFGAKEVVNGWVELAKAGFTVQEVLAGVGEAAIFLAAAGEITMAEATDVLSIAIRTFKLEAKDAVDVADLLAGVANASLSSVEDLATSFKYAAPVGAALGITLEDLVVALGLFSQVGLKGSTAGTSLRGMFVALTNASGPALKVMKELGIVLEDGTNLMFDSNGEAKGLGEMFQILQEKTKGLSKEHRLGALSAIFQRRALALVAEAAIQGEAGFEAMKKAAGRTTAEEVMEEKLDNLRGSLRRLGASLQTAGIIIGDEFIPLIRTVADAIRDAARWFSRLNPQVRRAAVFAFAGFGSFLLLGGALFKVGSMTIRAYKAFRELAEALGILKVVAASGAVTIAPWVAIAVGILAVIAALVALFIWWDKVWAFLMNNKWIIGLLAIFAPFILAILTAVGAIRWLYDNWQRIWPKIQRIAEAVVDWLETAWDDVRKAWDKVISWLKGAFKDVVQFFKDLPGNVVEGLEKAAEAIERFAKRVLEEIQHLPETLAGLAGRALNWLTTTGLNIMIGLIRGLLQGLFRVIEFFIKLPVKIVEAIGEVGSWLLGPGLDLLLGFLDGMIQALLDINEWIATELIPTLLDFFLDSGEWLIDAGFDVLTGFWDGALNAFVAVHEWFAGLGASTVNAVGDLLGSLVQAGKNLIKGLWDGALKIFTDVWLWLYNLPATLVSAVGDLIGSLTEAGKDLIRGFWEGAKLVAKKVVEWAKDFAQSVIKTVLGPLGFLIGSPSKKFDYIGRMVMEGLLQGLETGGAKVLDYMADLAPSLSGELSVAAIGGRFNRGLGTTPSAPSGPTRVTEITNHNEFKVLDAREAARIVMEESSWQARTLNGGSI